MKHLPFALCGAVWFFTAGAAAIEPAGGPPDPTPAIDEADEASEFAESPVQDELGEEPTQFVSNAEPDSQRSWLRRDNSKEASQPESGSGSAQMGATGLALLLLVGLGAAAIVLKRKRVTPRVLQRSGVRVVSSTRIGPKANLVTVDIGGRVLLLGVTDANVNELGWLDDDAQAAADGPREVPEQSDDASAMEPKGARPRNFKDVLGGALKGFLPAPLSQSPAVSASPLEAVAPAVKNPAAFAANAGVAAMLAESTADVLERRRLARSPSALHLASSGPARKLKTAASPGTPDKSAAEQLVEAPETPRVEDQVAGLARRRRN